MCMRASFEFRILDTVNIHCSHTILTSSARMAKCPCLKANCEQHWKGEALVVALALARFHRERFILG